MIFVSLLILFVIPCEPKDVGLPNIVGGGANQDPLQQTLTSSTESTTRIGYIEACFIPGVMSYALCYAFLKGVKLLIYSK